MLQHLYDKHRAIFYGKTMPEGSDLPTGWARLIDQLFFDFEAALSSSALRTLLVTQIKEKWGGLRVYYHVDGAYHDIVENLVEMASLKSESTCMKCGAQGNRCSSPVGVFTLCLDCRTGDMKPDGSKYLAVRTPRR